MNNVASLVTSVELGEFHHVLPSEDEDSNKDEKLSYVMSVREFSSGQSPLKLHDSPVFDCFHAHFHYWILDYINV